MAALLPLLQILAPLALLAWLAFSPAPSLLGWLLQALAVALFLWAVARVALWAVPPWWTTWLFAALWLAAVAAHPLRGGLSGAPLRPEGAWGWLPALAALALIALSGFALRAVHAASAPPAGQVVSLPNPLGPGRYLVGHGGAHPLLNVHLKVLDPSVPRFADWRGQAYAYDLLGRDRLGLTGPALRPRDPARYAIFGAPVHAPCAGEVLSAEADLPDMPVPEMDSENLMGNHVLLRCDDVAILLAHLRQGSVSVAPGDRVARGDRLGEVGNSGHSSEPHLHVHAQRPPAPGAAPISGEPLPLRLEGRWLLRNARLSGRAW